MLKFGSFKTFNCFLQKNENPCRAPKVIILTTGAQPGAGRRAQGGGGNCPPATSLAPPMHVILSDKWYGEKETDKDSVTEKIVKDAARLIASEIKWLIPRQNVQQLTKCQYVMTYCRHCSVCSLKVWSDLKLSSHL